MCDKCFCALVISNGIKLTAVEIAGEWSRHHSNPSEVAVFNVLVEFERRAKRATDLPELESLTEALIRSIGLQWFTLMRPRASPTFDSSIFMTNYPAEWVERVFADKRHLDDPIHAAVCRSVDGIQWRDIARLVKLTDHQKETLYLASNYGLRNGQTIPFRLTGMPDAMFSVGISRRSVIKSDLILAAKLLGSIVFAKAHELVSLITNEPAITRLSPRQIQCIRLISQGLTDKSIGKELALSPETVKEYVEDARQRYGALRRTQLIAAAIRDGHLTIEEAVDWRR